MSFQKWFERMPWVCWHMTLRQEVLTATGLLYNVVNCGIRTVMLHHLNSRVWSPSCGGFPWWIYAVMNRDVRILVPDKRRRSEESPSRLRLLPAALATCANGANEISSAASQLSVTEPDRIRAITAKVSRTLGVNSQTPQGVRGKGECPLSHTHVGWLVWSVPVARWSLTGLRLIEL